MYRFAPLDDLDAPLPSAYEYDEYDEYDQCDHYDQCDEYSQADQADQHGQNDHSGFESASTDCDDEVQEEEERDLVSLLAT